ncbi:DUF6455 family protein [Stappia sp. MMSF_3263]|uniref:DUF6455 family protein n=1 Tax=Stappia sp. MMSF_3263 TaxID=3046693 RepID=UPI00273CF611|nr:DUF6455 family protein [Stappia sp. MMSF_3263]
MGLMKRLDERAGLMGRMMRTVGASDAMPMDFTLETTMRAAIHRCMGCDRPQDCAGWLDAHEDGARQTPDYCRNGELFARWTGRD